MNYTSPSPANVGLNGNQTTWWIPARNLSTKYVDNVIVTVTVSPTAGLAPVTYLADVGTFNFNTGKWHVGKLAPGAVKWLKIVTSVSDIGLAPWTVTSVITGDGVDSNNTNNTLVQTLTSVVCSPTAGAVNDIGCACLDVSLNDTPCNYGVSEWRLNAASVTNSTTYSWDQTTGKSQFVHIDPTKDITGTYSLWCDSGSGFVEVSGPATFTITKIIENKNIFNHVPYFIQGSDLTPAEIAILQAQYPSITGIADVCWNIIRNGDGVLTGGVPVDCSEEQDTRTFFECTTEPCPATSPCLSCPQSYLPHDVYVSVMDAVNHEPEVGDIIFLQHPSGHSIHKWDGSMWVRSSCGCVEYGNPYPTAITVTGTTTKTVTVTMSEGAPLTTTFTDLDQNGNTTYTLVPNVSNTAFSLIDNNNNVVSTITFPITNCPSLNFALTESLGGPGDQVFLYVDGIDNTSPLWDTWVWQYALNYQYDGTATWVDAQTGGSSYTITTDDTSVRVVLTNGTCVYYSNVSGYYPTIAGDNWGTQVIQHAPTSMSSGNGTSSDPLFVCPDITLDVLPQISDVGNNYTLAINGIDNTSALWDTWVWQYSPKYGVGTNLNTNPIWIDGQTGGLTFTQGGDDLAVRVILINGNCRYYSNQSGYIPSVGSKVGTDISVTYSPHSHFEIGYTQNTPIRLEAFNYSYGNEVFPIITGAGDITNPSLVNYSPNSFTFQKMSDTPPYFTFTDVQVGEDPSSSDLKYVINLLPSETYASIRIKYSINGVDYYSNVVTHYAI